MVRLADYIIDYLHKNGVEYIFMVTGGGAMFLNDAIGYGPIKYVCTHHEQAATFAAKAYAQYTGKLGVVCVTTGCGGTNAITGVLDAFQDHAPILIISGQEPRKRTIQQCGLDISQFGVQEANIIPIVTPITKFAIMVDDPNKIKYYLNKALYLAYNKVPGPVWLDIPLDVQNAQINETSLEGFKPEKNITTLQTNKLSQLVMLLQTSERPIIIAGQGIRLANAIPEFKEFVESNNTPVVSTKLGIDIISHDNPLYVGTIGTKGDRAGNFAIQNSDLVLSIGSRLSVSTTGLDYSTFAREAKKVVVDINPVEHKKKTIKIDLFIESDVKSFFSMMHFIYIKNNTKNWIETCQHWKEIFKTYQPNFSETEKVNLYYFIEMLSQKLRSDDVIIGDAGSNMFVPAQGIHIRDNQRLVFSGGQTAMGFTLPACTGIAFAKHSDVIGICGDGSLQMNIHELQTIKHHNLPIKLFVLNNGGYLSMRNTQNAFFKRLTGATPETGVSFPSVAKIAQAYEITYFRIENSEETPKIIEEFLAYTGPAICEVMCLYEQSILTVASKQLPDGTFVSRPLEDMHPFLSREEFNREMIVKPLESSDE